MLLSNLVSFYPASLTLRLGSILVYENLRKVASASVKLAYRRVAY